MRGDLPILVIIEQRSEPKRQLARFQCICFGLTSHILKLRKPILEFHQNKEVY